MIYGDRMNNCEWLHRHLEELPLIKYPFKLVDLPKNGIYFFYEKGEIWGHGDKNPRIVRIGTHRGDNFRSRINDHFLFNDRKMNFTKDKPAPKDRSIFRKNIGRAILNKNKEDYLDVWNIDFTTKIKREKYSHLRDIKKEKVLENQITDLLRNNFSFRFLELPRDTKKMGKTGLESFLIGTVSKCEVCKSSEKWIGKYSPTNQIQNSGLWLVQHLNSDVITEENKDNIQRAVNETNNNFKRC